MKKLEIFAFGGLAIAFLVVVWMMKSAPEGEADWQKFVKDNNCVSLGDAGGNNRGGWKCEDGKIHYRWRQQR